MSHFTDPMAALEEAEFVAKEDQVRMYVVETAPNRIEVMTAEEAYTVDGIVLETIVPTGGHDIFQRVIMFVENSYDIKLPRLSAKNTVSNFRSIKKLKALWGTFDYETKLRAAKTIRCLETQEAYR